MTDPTHLAFWGLANDALAIGGSVSCLLALVLGMAFVKAVS